MNDIEKTKHFTTESYNICSNLISYIPSNVLLIEPFVGDGDLLSLFPTYQWELYDIEEHGNNIVQDTLKNPPNYFKKWVITNPPYLAKNKSTDKTIFNLYKTDDLYKAALLSILNCEGGILIIPTNFFTDDRTQDIRVKFLNQFEICEINIFTQPVFKSTTYSVCSFAFKRKSNEAKFQIIKCNIKPQNVQVDIELNPNYGYRIAGEFYNQIDSTKSVFNRLVGQTSNDFITNIKLYAIDTRNERIRLEYCEQPYYGKQSDRTYATFTCKYQLSIEQQKQLIKEFNRQLEDFRAKYHDLSMTNYRDYNRKRIGFTFAYKLASKILEEIL